MAQLSSWLRLAWLMRRLPRALCHLLCPLGSWETEQLAGELQAPRGQRRTGDEGHAENKGREPRDELRLVDDGEGKGRNGSSQQSQKAKYLQRTGQHPAVQIRNCSGCLRAAKTRRGPQTKLDPACPGLEIPPQ